MLESEIKHELLR